MNYETETRRLARQMFVDAIAEGNATEREIRHFFSDNVFLYAQQSPLVIYTHRNIEVLQSSKNRDAYFEDGSTLHVSSFMEAMLLLAIHALAADLCEICAVELDEWLKKEL